MIITVTPQTTLDLTLQIPALDFSRPVRATDAVFSMGGKPTNASFIVGKLGLTSLALGFAAGETGRKVEALLRESGAIPEFIEVEGDTRVCVNVVVGGMDGQLILTTSMMEVAPEHVARLREGYRRALVTASVVVMGGTLPRGMTTDFYPDLIRQARERNIPVIFDAAEPNLSAGLSEHPGYIKPNRDELSGLVGYPLETLQDIYEAGREVLARYGTVPVISLGGDGGMVVLPEGAYYVPPLAVPVISTTGAGDGVLSGLTAAVHRGQPITEGIRLGFGLAAAICMSARTADFASADLERLLPQIELRPFPA